ncbi:hypothetical protein DICVIV_08455 [Dictyocaulus viviparus]|uniref:Uncharacterized protein n=1 Tax=Dictyocaulus viviparus TaxID=29172 RepID=A0A0D8XP30_DICVI|nr:hypothetical protein DICVIV_08455 [Dictyocaulus viviparus]
MEDVAVIIRKENEIAEALITEQVAFATIKDRVEWATHHVKNKASIGDNLRCSITAIEAQGAELGQILEKEKKYLLLQETKISKKHHEIENLKSKNSEVWEKIVYKRKNLKELCERCSSTETKLSVVTAEIKDICKKLDSLRAESETTKNELTLYISSCQEEFNEKKEKMSLELRELEKQVTEKREELKYLNSDLEFLKLRFEKSPSMRDWDEKHWQEALQEKSVAHSSLEAEVNSFSNDIMKLEKEMENRCEEIIADSILALEQELIRYMEEKEVERRSVHSKSLDAHYKLNGVLEKVNRLQAINSEKDSEHAKLLLEVRDLQAQIQAFTTLCTPSKVVGLPVDENFRKSPTIGRCRSRRKDTDPDSDNDSSSSRVPHVEGLDPFSPVTISFKKRTKEESVARQEHLGSKFEAESESVNTSQHKIQTSRRLKTEPYSNKEHHYSASFSDSVGSDETPYSESLIAKRFPNDIFLSPSPSLGEFLYLLSDVSYCGRLAQVVDCDKLHVK